MKDGDLRSIFRKELRSWQWTSIETSVSASGVPDSEFCTPTGITGWIEYKQTKAFYVQVKPLQVAWLMRRCRQGGNAWIAVRRMNSHHDDLWLMFGDQAQDLFEHGLTGVHAWCWTGGPGNWNFEEVGRILQGLHS